MREVKLCIVGEMSVGKTSIISRFINGSYDSNYRATIGATFLSKTIQCDGKTVKYNIWDTAGQERFKTMNRMYYRGATVIIIVYDITDARTFSNLEFWNKEVENHRESNIVLTFVGNKSDLETEREVNKVNAQRFANENGALFFEVSARTSENIENLFQEISRNLPEPSYVPPALRQNGFILRRPENKVDGEKDIQLKCCT